MPTAHGLCKSTDDLPMLQRENAAIMPRDAQSGGPPKLVFRNGNGAELGSTTVLLLLLLLKGSPYPTPGHEPGPLPDITAIVRHTDVRALQ